MSFENSIKEQVLSVLGSIENPVEISIFVGSENEKECGETLGLLNDIAEIVPKVSIKKYDITDSFAKENNILKTPSLKIHKPGEKSSYTYSGLPSMYEFSTLIEAIRTVGNGVTDLSPNIIKEVKSIDKPTHIKIFVTPSCSFCPTMVIAGFRIAFENPNISVEIIESTSFRSEMIKHGVRSVPKTIINESLHIDGSVSIDQFVEKIKSV